MGKHFALTLQLPFYHTAQEKQKLQQASALRAIPVQAYYGMALFAIIIMFFVGYLIQINSFSTAGYKITSLQKQISKLQNDNANLEIDSAQLQSIQRIETDPSTYSMVPVTSVSYIVAPQNKMLTER